MQHKHSIEENVVKIVTTIDYGVIICAMPSNPESLEKCLEQSKKPPMFKNARCKKDSNPN
jgi:hypothetical protein